MKLRDRLAWLLFGVAIGVCGSLTAWAAGPVDADPSAPLTQLNTWLNAAQLIALVGGAGILMLRIGRMHGAATEQLSGVNTRLDRLSTEVHALGDKLNHHGERLARLEGQRP